MQDKQQFTLALADYSAALARHERPIPHSPIPENVPEPEESANPLTHYLWILRRHRWRILAFMAISVVAAIIISSRLTQYYESTAVIDVDRQMPSSVIGQDATRPINDSDEFLNTQIRLIQSDSVLRPVVQRLGLSERELEIPKETAPETAAGIPMGDTPVTLRRLKVSRPSNTYLINISYRSPNPQLAADVANEVAKSYRQHVLNIRYQATQDMSEFLQKQLEALRAKVESSSARLIQFEKDLNVVDPAEKTSILSARLIQLNAEFTNAQGDRVRKESALNAVEDGSLASLQASTQGEQIRHLAERLEEAKEKFAVVQGPLGKNHPEYRKAASQITEMERQLDDLKSNVVDRLNVEYKQALNRESILQKSVAEAKDEFDKINARSFEYKTVKQEAETDKGLYEELMKRVKEASINASFQNNSIRLADAARPARAPVFPNVPLNALLALLVSGLIAFGLAVLADSLDHTLRDPERIQRQFGAEVLGSLPMVKGWRGRLSAAEQGGASNALVAISTNQAGAANAYEEAIRTLRDSILLPGLNGDGRERPRSLLLTSATPGEGKSTTTAHLAAVHSQQKRKTLLIDADLRRPGVYRHFGVSNDTGISDVILHDNNWREALQVPQEFPYLTILPSGPISRRAADGLGVTLERILIEAAHEYDLVMIDAPPLLGFAETLQIAALVDGVVVVTLAGQTNKAAVANVFSSLKRLRANVIGLALNEVKSDTSERYYGYSGKYYANYYKPSAS